MAKQRAAPWEGGKEYGVELGASFDSTRAVHTVKYDFKPKSVDTGAAGRLSSDGRNVALTLSSKQQDQAAGSDVQFSGHAAKCKKDSEFVMVFNAERQVFVLERLTTAIALKQNRGHKRAGGALARVDVMKKVKQLGKKRRVATSQETASTAASSAAGSGAAESADGAASPSSSSSDDDDEDDDDEAATTATDKAHGHTEGAAADAAASDSDSDSGPT